MSRISIGLKRTPRPKPMPTDFPPTPPSESIPACAGCRERDLKIIELAGRLRGLAETKFGEREEYIKKLMANRRAKGLPKFTAAARRR